MTYSKVPKKKGKLREAVEMLQRQNAELVAVNEYLLQKNKEQKQKSTTQILHQTDEVLLQTYTRQCIAITQLGQRTLSNVELEHLLGDAARLVTETLDIEYCQVLEYHAEKHIFLLRAGIGWKKTFIGHAHIPDGHKSHAGFTLLTQEPIIVADFSKEERFTKSALCVDHDIVSGLSVIIPGAKHPFGTLGIYAKTKREFTQRDINFLNIAAITLAQAIENKHTEHMFQRRNRELEMLYRASQSLISTLDLDQILVNVLEEVRRLLDVVACSIWLIDTETDELVCKQVIGPQSDIVRGWRLSLGEGIVGEVAHSGQSLIVADARKDKRHFKGIDQQTGLDLHAILSVPLKIKNTVTGVLQIVDTTENRFTSSSVTLLEPLAATAAMVIENARLFEETRQVNKTKTMLLDEVNHRVKNNLASIMGILALEMQRPIDERGNFKATLQDLQSRIQGLATVHSLLSAMEWAPLSISALVEEITQAALSISPIRHRIKVAVNTVTPNSHPPLLISPQQATSVALIINELTINSIQHAFHERDEGQIDIRITIDEHDEQLVTILYQDDGPGWPTEVLQNKLSGVGLHLIRGTVHSPLHGELQLHNNHGAGATVSFKLALVE